MHGETTKTLDELPVLEYELEPFREIGAGRRIQEITLSRTKTRTGRRWKVRMGERWVLAKEERFFVYDPMFSSGKTDEFRENTYFDSPEEALAFWFEHGESILDELERG